MSVGRSVGWLVGWLVGRSRKRLKWPKRLILTCFLIPITFHALPHSFSFIQPFIPSFIHSSKTFIHEFLIKRGALIGLHLALFACAYPQIIPRRELPGQHLRWGWLSTWSRNANFWYFSRNSGLERRSRMKSETKIQQKTLGWTTDVAWVVETIPFPHNEQTINLNIVTFWGEDLTFARHALYGRWRPLFDLRGARKWNKS